MYVTTPRQIVIVDDDSCLVESISAIVADEGYVPITFNSGKKMLSQLQYLTPDLFLLDIRLPDISGDSIAKIIKRQPQLAKIPVIFISANANLTEISDPSLANAFLPKPFDFDKLLNLIDTYLTTQNP